MTRAELLEILANGENSGVEFKRDDVSNEKFAREVVALTNSYGGIIVLGADDEGNPVGIARDRLEEWVMTACRDKIRPEIIPYFEVLRDVQPGKHVAVVRVERGWSVHHLWHNQHRTWLIRVGSESREASQEELARLMAQRQSFRVDTAPVNGTTWADLDLRRLKDYFRRVRGQPTPEDEDHAGWRTLLSNTEFLADQAPESACTLAGLVLFGRAPASRLPQSGIDATAYPGELKDYSTIERARLRGPLVGLFAGIGARGELVETGLVEQVLAFVHRTAQNHAVLRDGARREDISVYPEGALREVIVNAIAHRDYLLSGATVEVSLYSDRLEVISPGRLPNGITPARMRAGCRYARNPLIRDVLQDYGYMEAQGMGVPRKIVAEMLAHNGTNPDLEVRDEEFLVRLKQG